MLTLMSLMSWVAPTLVTRTRWVSALPYWLSPRTIVMTSDLCKSSNRTGSGSTEHGGACRVLQPVFAGLERRARQLFHPALPVGHATAHDGPLATRRAPAERHRQAGGRPPASGVEHVGGHAHSASIRSSRSLVILRCSAAATSISAEGSLLMRCRRATSISPAVRPDAEMRNTWPKRAS